MTRKSNRTWFEEYSPRYIRSPGRFFDHFLISPMSCVLHKRGLYSNMSPMKKCGHLVKVIWSFSISGTRLFAHYNININIYIIVVVLTASVFDFDQMTMTKWPPPQLKKFAGGAKSGGIIREPQWKNITFATSMKMNDGAPSAAENIFQAWENFLAAQRVKIVSLESAKTINIKQ